MEIAVAWLNKIYVDKWRMVKDMTNRQNQKYCCWFANWKYIKS